MKKHLQICLMGKIAQTGDALHSHLCLERLTGLAGKPFVLSPSVLQTLRNSRQVQDWLSVQIFATGDKGIS